MCAFSGTGTTSFITSATPSASPNQSQPTTTSMMALPEVTPPDIISAVTAMLEEATNQLEASHAVTESNTCRLRNRGVTANISEKTKKIELEVNESMLTLLLKLHDKLSGKQHSYVPETIRGVSSDHEMESRIGDGVFFVGKLLDKICRKSEESARSVETMYRESIPREGGSSGKGKKKIGEMDKEER